ncbi:hypothetical protein YC2023_057737 [Brassica napus]
MDMSLLQLHKMKVELEELMNTIVMPPSCMNKMSTGFSCIYSGYGHEPSAPSFRSTHTDHSQLGLGSLEQCHIKSDPLAEPVFYQLIIPTWQYISYKHTTRLSGEISNRQEECDVPCEESVANKKAKEST